MTRLLSTAVLIASIGFMFSVSAVPMLGHSPAQSQAAQVGRTIRVPLDQPSIRQALALAQPGDTVRIAPGRYHEDGLSIPGGVHLIGSGWARTILIASGVASAVLSSYSSDPRSDVLIDGMTVTGVGHGSGKNSTAGNGSTENGSAESGIVYQGSGRIIVRHSRVSHLSVGISISCSTCLSELTGNIIFANSQAGIAIYGPEVHIEHNTVVANGQGIRIQMVGPTSPGAAQRQPGSVTNNIVAGNGTTGIAVAGSVAPPQVQPCPSIIRNDVWADMLDMSVSASCASATMQRSNLTLAPLFRNMAGGDLSLQAGSPAIGRSLPQHDDLGALPFTPDGTAPARLTAHWIHGSDWLLSWSPVNASGYQLYLGTQPGLYTRRLMVGSHTAYRLSGVPAGITLYAAVSALHPVAGSGAESRLSPAATIYVAQSVASRTYAVSSLAFAFDGSWKPVNRGSSNMTSNTAGDSVDITFSGDSIVLYRQMGPDEGAALVSIDGRPLGALSFLFPQTRWNVPALFDHLGTGPHTLRLTLPATYNNLAGINTGRGRIGLSGPVTIGSITVPGAQSPTVEQQVALQVLNGYRQQVGEAPLRLSAALNAAAQASADYWKQNSNYGNLSYHIETAGRSGFVGEQYFDRAAYFGYPTTLPFGYVPPAASTGGIQVTTGGSTTEEIGFAGEPHRSVTYLMSAPYHRRGLLTYGATELGFGLSMTAAPHPVGVLELGAGPISTDASAAHYPAHRLLITYPAAGQHGVPTSWFDREVPDPIPGQPLPAGYPISLFVVQPALTPKQLVQGLAYSYAPSMTTRRPATRATLTNAAGRVLPIYLLDMQTDPNHYLGPDEVVLIPRQPLAAGTTYTVHIAGVDSLGATYTRTWSFTTA